MNERQNMVVATTVAGLMLILVYLCPWRIESTNELRWSAINQPPMSYVRSYDEGTARYGSSRIESEDAHIAYGILALQLLGLTATGGMLYWFFGDEEEAKD